MNKLEMHKLALDLWNDIVDNGYSLKKQSKYYKDVEKMRSNCPLCELYLISSACSDCPLAAIKEGYNCGCWTHPFYVWISCECERGREEAARRIVELIQEDYDKLKEESVLKCDDCGQ